jgi:hypothetical protein
MAWFVRRRYSGGNIVEWGAKLRHEEAKRLVKALNAVSAPANDGLGFRTRQKKIAGKEGQRGSD